MHRFIVASVAVLSVAVTLNTPAWAGQPQPVAAPSQAAIPGPAALDLTMERAVEMALEANLGLKADRMDLESADHLVAAARAAFLPQVGTSLSRSSQKSLPNDFTQGDSDISSQGLTFGTAFSHELPVLGTGYNLSWNSNRRTQTGGIPSFNPSLGSSFAFSLVQPLWRGFMTDQARTSLTTTQRRRTVADLLFEQQTVRLQSTVRIAYLDLISARQGLRVAQQNMDIRQQSLANARARVAVGAAAPIDLISAEAEVASNQEAVLQAEAQIGTREDALRTLIFDPARPDYWLVPIDPIDSIESQQRDIDLDAAIKNALANRVDLIAARQELEIGDLNLRVARDSTRPQVDLQLNYSANGSGGTRFIYDEGFPPVVKERIERSFGSVLNDAFGAAYPQWSLGVNVAYPLGRSAAEANLAQQQVTRRQSELDVRQLELDIVRQIREVARQVRNSYQRVEVTRTALAASEQQLEAEQRRFAAGLSNDARTAGAAGAAGLDTHRRTQRRYLLQPRVRSISSDCRRRSDAGKLEAGPDQPAKLLSGSEHRQALDGPAELRVRGRAGLRDPHEFRGDWCKHDGGLRILPGTLRDGRAPGGPIG